MKYLKKAYLEYIKYSQKLIIKKQITNCPKCEKEFYRHFIKEDVRVPTKHIKICSTSSVKKEMHIKTTKIYCYRNKPYRFTLKPAIYEISTYYTPLPIFCIVSLAPNSSQSDLVGHY